MAVEYSPIAPWLDNWTIQRQLWQGVTRNPGDELNLISTNRLLTVQWRDLSNNTVVLSSNELQTGSLIKIAHQQRGIVEVTASGDAWKTLRTDRTYQCEILAYGFLYDTFPFNMDLPEPGYELLSGSEVYGSPREILELITAIPGADVQTFVNLSGGWTQNAQGYWVKTVDASLTLYGLFVNDVHARQVDYANLALGCTRQWARVGNTVYYKGPDNLADPFIYVETAFSRYVLRSLQEATAEFERKAGTQFALRRVYRELHQGKYHQNQISARVPPVTVDRYFRFDNFNRVRTIVRRFTEADVFSGRANQSNEPNRLVVDKTTGVITLTEQFWDFFEFDNWSRWGARTAFATGEVAIEVTYTGGYEYIPVDVSEAVANTAACRMLAFWERLLSQGMEGISLGCANLRFADSRKYSESWRSDADSIAANYQRFEIQPF